MAVIKQGKRPDQPGRPVTIFTYNMRGGNGDLQSMRERRGTSGEVDVVTNARLRKSWDE